MTSAFSSAVPGRECGTCMMCCKTMTIPELQKPAGQWCQHIVKGRGCGIHGSHPAMCKAFMCLWIQDAGAGDEWKPDRSRFVVSIGPNGGFLISVDPNFPSSWRKEPYLNQIKLWANQGAETGRFLFVRIGARCIVLLPDGEHDLGEVGIDDDIRIGRSGPGGPWNVDVVLA